jgi:hypothetical protein
MLQSPTEKNEMLTLAEDSMFLKEYGQQINAAIKRIKQKGIWVILMMFVGIAIGFAFAYFDKPVYVARLTFALEEERSAGGGLGGALGLASSLGIDVGSNAGGAFSGVNIPELMVSRLIIEKALLNNISIGNAGEVYTLAQFLINEKFIITDQTLPQNKGNSALFFPVGQARSNFSPLQDSLMGELYQKLMGKNKILTVAQKDKKVSIFTIEVKSAHQIFAKRFAESVSAEVSDFYITTKSKKAKANVEILQRQSDSIRNELNNAIMGVATANDNTFALNQAIQAPRAAGVRKQVDVQANTAILTQLVTSLELAKMSLRKETPLIQTIDTPILPLSYQRLGRLKAMASGGILAGIAAVLFITLANWVRIKISPDKTI